MTTSETGLRTCSARIEWLWWDVDPDLQDALKRCGQPIALVDGELEHVCVHRFNYRARIAGEWGWYCLQPPYGCGRRYADWGHVLDRSALTKAVIDRGHRAEGEC